MAPEVRRQISFPFYACVQEWLPMETKTRTQALVSSKDSTGSEIHIIQRKNHSEKVHSLEGKLWPCARRRLFHPRGEWDKCCQIVRPVKDTLEQRAREKWARIAGGRMQL